MKTWLASVPIRSKLMLLASLVGVVALLISGGINAFTQYHAGRRALLHRLQTHADMVALNSSAAVAFDDAEAAGRILDALRADPAITGAQILGKHGAQLVQRRLVMGTGSDIEISADIVLGEQIGAVHIWATSEELRAELRRDAAMLLVVLAGALGIALVAASHFQHIISDPILELESAASAVSRTRDYAVRVRVSGHDEVGRLIRSFNDMLEQLDARAQEASGHRAELENKVAARTAELAAALKNSEAGARAKADFLANMSHEIRTPMNGVIGMLDLLHAEKLDADARSMLETAQSSADALLTLINNVLDFSKIDAGKLTLEKIDVELRPLAEEVAMLFTQQANAKGVEMTCVVHNNVPTTVGGDPTRLRQIMVNLIGNAVKFTHRGEVLLAIQEREARGAQGGSSTPSAAKDEPAHMIQILVQDTGIGMSTEAKQQLFQVFTQADASTTRKYGGTGLGLAITKSLVDAMGGTIKVTSEPGKGSTFSVIVPLEVRSRVPQPRARGSRGLRVLIVDDNPTNRCILEHYLHHEEAKYQCVASARAGLEAARAAAIGGMPFDVVLLDYQMPEMDGAGFLREMRADVTIANTPCIVLSSLGDRVAEADALRVSAWLTKPVRKAQLQDLLARVVGTAVQERMLPAQASVGVLHTGARVLLVEDNKVNTEVAQRLLKTFGVEAIAVKNGQEAVKRVQAQRFDLVLMDCQMPVMDGYEAAAAIREWESRQSSTGEGPRLPIVAMTANALQGDREKCLAAGMDDYITKPVKRHVLATALGRWLAVVPGPSEPADDARNSVLEMMADVRNPEPVPAGARANESALDMTTVAQLGELMGDDLADLIGTYLSDTPMQLDKIAAAIEQRDYVVVQRSAHSVKSSSSSLGAVVLNRVAAVLEALPCTEGCFDEAERLLAALRGAFNVVKPKLLGVAAAEQARLMGRTAQESNSAQQFVKGASPHM